MDVLLKSYKNNFIKKSEDGLPHNFLRLKKKKNKEEEEDDIMKFYQKFNLNGKYF